MRRNLTLFVTGLGVFLLFVLFSYLVHKNLFTQLDFDTTVRLQDKISRRFDHFFSLFSLIGGFEPMLISLVAVLVLLRKIIAGVALFSCFVMFHMLEIFGKFFVDHPPPPEFMLRTERLVEFPQFHVRAEFSYPSGHSGRTVFLAIIILFFLWDQQHLPFWLKVAITGIVGSFVLIMMLSRVYLGEHWMSDVFGGGVLGLSLSLMGLAFYPKKRVRVGED